MKKIKQKLVKCKVKDKPVIGLLLNAEQRAELVRFTLEWCQTLQGAVKDTLELKIWVSDVPNLELDMNLKTLDQERGIFQRLTVPRGVPVGQRRNDGLSQLKKHKLDAVIPLEPGDLLTPDLLMSYASHLKSGALFCGLLDQYLYDPSALRCMHWARAEFKQGVQRACDLALLVTPSLLDRLDWELWPPTAQHGRDNLHEQVMKRLSRLFGLAPANTCLLQSMSAHGGRAVSIKSELGRVLFDEGNWQRLPGLSFADFEIDFEDALGADWIERVEDFDERINLAVLVEPPAAGASHTELWRALYQFLPFKFDPYAHVEVYVICDESEHDEVRSWGSAFTPLSVNADSQVEHAIGTRWNQAVAKLTSSEVKRKFDALLFGGSGSIVDLKTIEHYLIYLFKHGARLLSASNFFVSMEFDGERQGHFWPGVPNATFKQSFGFGTCIHKRYVQRLGADLFAPDGSMSVAAQAALDKLSQDVETKLERVMFQCVAHKLGLIAFEAEGALGFSPQIRLADLKPITISKHLPTPALVSTQHDLLHAWERGETLELGQSSSLAGPFFGGPNDMGSSRSTDVLHLSNSPLSQPEETTMSNDSNPMSPLERAKALLRQSQGGAAADSASSSTQKAGASVASDVTPDASPEPTLSPLERAKALLKQSTQSASDTSESTAQSAPAVAQAPERKAPLSPLERAKELLKEPAQSVTQATPPTNATELSPLERAKALLKQSTQKASQAASPSAESEAEGAVINQAVQGAEALVAHLESQLQAARVQEKTEASTPAVSGPALVLCEQGEDAFAQQDITRALALFESALLVDPSCTRALNNLGVIALQSDEPWRALSFLLMGLIQAPQDEDVAINLRGLFDLHPEMKTARAVIFDA